MIRHALKGYTALQPKHAAEEFWCAARPPYIKPNRPEVWLQNQAEMQKSTTLPLLLYHT